MLITLFLMVDLAPAQMQMTASRRDMVSKERAQRMEAMIDKAYPGVSLDWDREQLVYPNGNRVSFTFQLYKELPQPNDNAVLVIASHTMNEKMKNDAVQQIQNFRGQPTEFPVCRLSLMRSAPYGRVLGYKEITIDVPDVPSSCSNVNFDYAYGSAGVLPPFSSAASAPNWPWVIINYTTLHALPDAWATITWAAVLDTDTLRWVTRLPVWFEGRRRDGKATVFAIHNDHGKSGGNEWVFSGYDGREENVPWQYRTACSAGDCRVDPRLVLDSVLSSGRWK